MKKVKIGIVGCGVISGIYIENFTTMFKDIVEIVATADLIHERAETAAAKCGATAMSNDDLFNHPEIEIVVNLTTPDAHALVNIGALTAGKSAYTEKPHAITREEGQKTKSLAKEKGVLLGGAPDTFLGGGIQTCRKLIDDGWIGEPIAATAFMVNHGHESWHPAPEFYYKTGAGPMFDMGPYYLTALINLMGPVADVAGSARKTFETRKITSQPLCGKIIDVEVPTHIAGILNFKSGAVGTIITSFDVWGAELPRIEIYGTRGTLSVPDPNTFGGPVRLRRANSSAFEEIPLVYGYQNNSRGLGVADMAVSLRTGNTGRANGDLTYHVLDIMHAFHDASMNKANYTLTSSCERPAPLPLGLRDGEVS